MKAVIIGAGPAGLAAAACLKQVGADVVLLEKAGTIASSWEQHYDCLHLHTARVRSQLPGPDYPASVGRYPSRTDVIAYLRDYQRHHDLRPRLGCNVTGVSKSPTGWQVSLAEESLEADVVVMATGLNGAPHLPANLTGTDFAGQILHASAYRNPNPYIGHRALVVGFGNSGGDIALDLADAGVDVTLSVRGPVNILPKELLGVPITSFGLLSKLLGYRLADTLTAPILRLAVGRPEDYGLQSTGKGPGARVIEDGRVPLIDVGTLGAIKHGRIAVKPGIDRVTTDMVHFTDGTNAPFDAVIAATGYLVDLNPLLGADCGALDGQGRPKTSGADNDLPGLFFCSYRVSPDGQLFATAQEARAIAAKVRDDFGLAPPA